MSSTPDPAGSPSSVPSFWVRMSTTFGLGYLRPASGTWGSLPPALLAGAMLLASSPLWLMAVVMGLIAVAFTAACVMGGDEAEARFNRKDPGQVVADETAGMALALIWLPAQAFGEDALGVGLFAVALSFFVFRIMDILKPWPIAGLQRIPGGWGIVIDDLLAGVLTALIVHGAAWANATRVAAQIGAE